MHDQVLILNCYPDILLVGLSQDGRCPYQCHNRAIPYTRYRCCSLRQMGQFQKFIRKRINCEDTMNI
jgi:hypothetical protein